MPDQDGTVLDAGSHCCDSTNCKRGDNEQTVEESIQKKNQKTWRYARLKWTPVIKEYADLENARANLGDLFQCIAIEKLYKKIGIQEELIEIRLDELKTYRGEFCILPLHVGIGTANIHDLFPVSPHIRPVFFAVTMIIDVFEEFPEYVVYFKQYEPIGCRDERTYQIFVRHGIQAYIVGCTTFALDSSRERQRETYFLTDIPQSIRSFLPQNVAEDAAESFHEIPLLKYPMDDQEYERVYRCAQERLEMYDRSAKCIVTTRLHGIVPALAMGIPVIAVSNNIDFRFSFVDKYIKVYRPDEFEDIDWSGQTADVDVAKELLTSCFKEMLLGEAEGYSCCEKSTAFYQDRECLQYNFHLNNILDRISNICSKTSILRYCIWGCGMHGFLAHEMMRERFPESELVCLVDKYETGTLFNRTIERKTSLEQYEFDVVLVTTSSGKEEAEKYLTAMGKQENKDYFFFMSKEARLRKKISIVVPTYNEEKNIIPLVQEIRSVFETQLQSYCYEILFTDNKSTDGTRNIIEKLCREDKHIKAIFNVRNFLGGSAMNGLRASKGDCAVFMAADLQDPPGELPKFVEKWENGAKIVVGVKNKSQTNPLMHKLRGLYYKLMRKISTVEQIEQFASYALYDSSFIDVLRGFEDARPYLRGIVCELGGDIERVEYVQEQRRAGKSSQNFARLFDFAMIGITSYTKAPIRAATFTGAIALVMSSIIAAIYLIMKLLNWHSMPIGIAPIIILICMFGSLHLFFLGLIGEYILNINIRTMNHPTVVEEKRINFEEIKNMEAKR